MCGNVFIKVQLTGMMCDDVDRWIGQLELISQTFTTVLRHDRTSCRRKGGASYNQISPVRSPAYDLNNNTTESIKLLHI